MPKKDQTFADLLNDYAEAFAQYEEIKGAEHTLQLAKIAARNNVILLREQIRAFEMQVLSQ